MVCGFVLFFFLMWLNIIASSEEIKYLLLVLIKNKGRVESIFMPEVEVIFSVFFFSLVEYMNRKYALCSTLSFYLHSNF